MEFFNENLTSGKAEDSFKKFSPLSKEQFEQTLQAIKDISTNCVNKPSSSIEWAMSFEKFLQETFIPGFLQSYQLSDAKLTFFVLGPLARQQMPIQNGDLIVFIICENDKLTAKIQEAMKSWYYFFEEIFTTNNNLIFTPKIIDTHKFCGNSDHFIKSVKKFLSTDLLFSVRAIYPLAPQGPSENAQPTPNSMAYKVLISKLRFEKQFYPGKLEIVQRHYQEASYGFSTLENHTIRPEEDIFVPFNHFLMALRHEFNLLNNNGDANIILVFLSNLHEKKYINRLVYELLLDIFQIYAKLSTQPTHPLSATFIRKLLEKMMLLRGLAAERLIKLNTKHRAEFLKSHSQLSFSDLVTHNLVSNVLIQEKPAQTLPNTNTLTNNLTQERLLKLLPNVISSITQKYRPHLEQVNKTAYLENIARSLTIIDSLYQKKNNISFDSVQHLMPSRALIDIIIDLHKFFLKLDIPSKPDHLLILFKLVQNLNIALNDLTFDTIKDYNVSLDEAKKFLTSLSYGDLFFQLKTTAIALLAHLYEDTYLLDLKVKIRLYKKTPAHTLLIKVYNKLKQLRKIYKKTKPDTIKQVLQFLIFIVDDINNKIDSFTKETSLQLLKISDQELNTTHILSNENSTVSKKISFNDYLENLSNLLDKISLSTNDENSQIIFDGFSTIKIAIQQNIPASEVIIDLPKINSPVLTRIQLPRSAQQGSPNQLSHPSHKRLGTESNTISKSSATLARKKEEATPKETERNRSASAGSIEETKKQENLLENFSHSIPDISSFVEELKEKWGTLTNLQTTISPEEESKRRRSFANKKSPSEKALNKKKFLAQRSDGSQSTSNLWGTSKESKKKSPSSTLEPSPHPKDSVEDKLQTHRKETLPFEPPLGSSTSSAGRSVATERTQNITHENQPPEQDQQEIAPTNTALNRKAQFIKKLEEYIKERKRICIERYQEKNPKAEILDHGLPVLGQTIEMVGYYNLVYRNQYKSTAASFFHGAPDGYTKISSAEQLLYVIHSPFERVQYTDQFMSAILTDDLGAIVLEFSDQWPLSFLKAKNDYDERNKRPLDVSEVILRK